MSILVSSYLSVDAEVFESTGAFDSVLDFDSRLFIDPKLIRQSNIPEMVAAARRLDKHFSDAVLLLSNSHQAGDRFWRKADKMFAFPEVQGICLGYSSTGSSGSGMGQTLRSTLIRTAKEIIDSGVVNPVFFELVGLLEEGIGPDRISDMVARVIYEDLLKYSERVFSELGVDTQLYKFDEQSYQLVLNPFNNHPIVLLPKEILAKLPVARDWSDIDEICSHNETLRKEVNSYIGDTWKKAVREKKRVLKSVLMKHPEVLKDLVDCYVSKTGEPYDFDSDPSGEGRWLQIANRLVSASELTLEQPENTEQLIELVQKICLKFGELLSECGLCKLLYQKDGKPKHENAAQLIFFAVADIYCQANNVDVTREGYAGRGPVDFKVATSYRERVLVEIKLSTNKRLLHGLQTQLKQYEEATKPVGSFFVVVDVDGGSEKRLSDLYKYKNEQAIGTSAEIVLIDARKKQSPSVS